MNKVEELAEKVASNIYDRLDALIKSDPKYKEFDYDSLCVGYLIGTIDAAKRKK